MVFKTSTLTLWEKHELWESEIWLLSKIFGYKREAAREMSNKFNNEKLYDLHVWTNITHIRVIKLCRMRYATQVARMNEKRNLYRVLMGKPEVKKPFESSRPKLEITLNQGLKVVWDGAEWIHLAQDRDMEEIVCTRWGNYGLLRNPKMKISLANWETISFPKNTLFHGLRSRIIYFFSCTTWRLLSMIFFMFHSTLNI
jgi:hypothetical protein